MSLANIAEQIQQIGCFETVNVTADGSTMTIIPAGRGGQSMRSLAEQQQTTQNIWDFMTKYLAPVGNSSTPNLYHDEQLGALIAPAYTPDRELQLLVTWMQLNAASLKNISEGRPPLSSGPFIP